MEIAVTNLQPIIGSLNRLIVEPIVDTTKKPLGGMIDPFEKEKPLYGMVLSISETDHQGVKPSLKPGDEIMYGRAGNTVIPLDGKDYHLLTENDVWSKIVK